MIKREYSSLWPSKDCCHVFGRICCLAMFLCVLFQCAFCQSSIGQEVSLDSPVRLDENAIDSSAGNLACYKIETPSATYFLEKKGLGLSSLLDTEGVDWISFQPEKGTGARGEYRGFPNAVYKEGGSFFHPLNAGTDHSTSSVEKHGPKHVSILGVSGNSEWECRWDFFATHCTFTMTKMPAGRKYWVLYEGTPGGECDADDWWMTSASQEKMPLNTRQDNDLPATEWMAFGDPRLGRTLFLLHREDDEHLDQYYLMHESMTVFGFGRKKVKKYIDTVPQAFTIGFVESTQRKEIKKHIETFSAGEDK